MAVTYFFRDSQTLELLVQRALPVLCDQASIHIWDAGCANGAEPYTLAMLLREQMTGQVFGKVRICATDVDPEVAVRELPPESTRNTKSSGFRYAIRSRCFQATGAPGYVQVIDDVCETRCRLSGTICFRWNRRATTSA